MVTTPCIELDTSVRYTVGGPTSTTKHWYDGWGRLIETQAPSPTSGQTILSYNVYYNDGTNGHEVIASMPYAIATPSGYVAPDLTQARSVTKYDGLNRSYGVTTYNSGGSTIALQTTLSYSVAQGVTGISSENGVPYEQTTALDGYSAPGGSYASDPIGRATAEAFSSSVGSGWRCSGYDQRGQLDQNTLSVTVDGQTSTTTMNMSYNDGGELASLVYPDQEPLTSQYDTNGNLLSVYFGTPSSPDPVNFLVGQFVRADSVTNAGGRNGYGYVGGNPETYVDPSGQRPVSAGDGGSSDGASTFVPTAYHLPPPRPRSSPSQFTPSKPCWDVGCRYGANLQISTTEVLWHRTSYSTGGVVCFLFCMALQYQSQVTTYTIYRTDKALPVQLCTLPFTCEGENEGDEQSSEGERPAVDTAADEGAKPVEGAPRFPNRNPRGVPSEVESARELGVHPMKIGDPELTQMIKGAPGGELKIKWAVNPEGELRIIPYRVSRTEIYHSVIFDGGDVLSAGEGILTLDESDNYVATDLNDNSGHYVPGNLASWDAAYNKYGIPAFEAAKVQGVREFIY